MNDDNYYKTINDVKHLALVLKSGNYSVFWNNYNNFFVYDENRPFDFCRYVQDFSAKTSEYVLEKAKKLVKIELYLDTLE